MTRADALGWLNWRLNPMRKELIDNRDCVVVEWYVECRAGERIKCPRRYKNPRRVLRALDDIINYVLVEFQIETVMAGSHVMGYK